jgi:hypothetical protein
MGFQTVVNAQPAPAVAGDFASQNPRHNTLAAAGQLVAPAGGLIVGNFFFINPATGLCSQSYGNGYTQIAFLARNSQGLITHFLEDSSMRVPQGFMVVGFDGGDFYAKFDSGIAAGATVYADEVTGAPSNIATNSVTGSVGFAGTASFATDVMTVVTQTANSLIEVGDVVTSAGVTAGTTVTALLSGTPGAVGSTYSLSTTPGTIATQAATTASNVLNVTAVASGGLSVGDTISGTNVTAGTTIASILTGAGGVGTYLLNIPGGVPFHTASETITGPANVATGFTATSTAAVGELAVIYAAA